MQENDYVIPSMHDENKAKEVQEILKGIKGIYDVDANYEDSILSVFYDENEINISDIKKTLRRTYHDIEDKKV